MSEEGDRGRTGRRQGRALHGAARGQGRSHAVALAEEGADVIAVDVCADNPVAEYPLATADDLEQTVNAVEALDRRIVAVQADVRDAEALRAPVAQGVATPGSVVVVVVVVANAGICVLKTWDEVTPAIWQAILDVNLTGVWNTMTATVPHLIAAGGGSIICTGSTTALKGVPFFVPYVAAKHGVVGLAEMMANELGQHSIRVTGLSLTVDAGNTIR